MDTSSTEPQFVAGEVSRASRFAGLTPLYQAVMHWSLVVLFFLIPLAVLPVTTEILEINKQTLLVVATFVGTLAWLGLMINRREVTFRKGWLNVLPLLFLVAVFISAFLSPGGFVSWVGQTSQEYMSFLTTAAFVVLFILLVNTASELKTQRRLIGALLLSATIVSVQMLLQAFGVPVLGFLGLPGASANTIGTMNAAGIFLIIATVLSNALWLLGKTKPTELTFPKKWNKIFAACTIILSLSTLLIVAAIDYWVLSLVLLIGIVILFSFAMVKAGEFSETSRFVLPMGLLVVALFLLFLPSPLHLNLPPEVTPSQSATWSIATASLSGASAMFGSGPGTFVQDYAKFHSFDLNQTDFWNVRFDRGSYVLTLLATLGIVGAVLFLIMVFALLIRALNRLVHQEQEDGWKTIYVLFAGWLSLVVALALYSSNLTLLFLFWAFSGLLASHLVHKKKTLSFHQSPRAGLIFSFLFVLVAVGIVTGLFVTGQRYAAEIAFAQAVKLDSTGGDLTAIIQKLNTATSFNRLSDTYYRNLSQALLLQVQKELAVNPLPPEKTTYIQELIGASVNSAKRATEIAPNNVANWEMLGSIYREVSPVVSGAADASISAFEKAHELEPANPTHIADLGRSYLTFAETARAQTTSEDQATADSAKAAVADNLKKAEDALTKAITLKTDYAPAHYYLALVYEREGRLEDAIAKMEAVKTYNPLDVGVAFQLGILNLRAGKYDPAQVELERAVQLMPDYANARWFLAAIYEQKGLIDKAIEQVQQVLASNPDNELVKAKLLRLQSGEVSSGIPEPVESGAQTATTLENAQPKQ